MTIQQQEVDELTTDVVASQTNATSATKDAAAKLTSANTVERAQVALSIAKVEVSKQLGVQPEQSNCAVNGSFQMNGHIQHMYLPETGSGKSSDELKSMTLAKRVVSEEVFALTSTTKTLSDDALELFEKTLQAPDFLQMKINKVINDLVTDYSEDFDSPDDKDKALEKEIADRETTFADIYSTHPDDQMLEGGVARAGTPRQSSPRTVDLRKIDKEEKS